jgi:hypothetical protein
MRNYIIDVIYGCLCMTIGIIISPDFLDMKTPPQDLTLSKMIVNQNTCDTTYVYELYPEN